LPALTALYARNTVYFRSLISKKSLGKRLMSLRESHSGAKRPRERGSSVRARDEHALKRTRSIAKHPALLRIRRTVIIARKKHRTKQKDPSRDREPRTVNRDEITRFTRMLIACRMNGERQQIRLSAIAFADAAM